MLSGVLIAALAVVGLMAPHVDENSHLVSAGDYAVQTGIVISAALAFGGLLGLRMAQKERPRFGRLGNAGSLVALAGEAIIVTANIVTLPTGDPVTAVHAIGFLAFFAGSVLLAIATHRVGLLPRWSAVLLGATPVVLFAGPPGGLVVGASWIAIGWALRNATVRDAGSKPAGAPAV
jgi:hypothetical protein